MVKEIVQIGNPILEKKTRHITKEELKSKSIQALIKDMLDTCIALEKRSAGLSAPQIGESLAICICRRVDFEEIEVEKENPVDVPREKLWEIIINPKVKKIGKKEGIFWEGCLSIGKEEADTLYGPVSRPNQIEIEYLDKEGNTKSLVGKGFMAHVIQHELDHLDGVLFLGKVVNPDKNLWKGSALDSYLKDHDDYPEIQY